MFKKKIIINVTQFYFVCKGTHILIDPEFYVYFHARNQFVK